jgi:hypothetical protein
MRDGADADWVSACAVRRLDELDLLSLVSFTEQDDSVFTADLPVG